MNEKDQAFFAECEKYVKTEEGRAFLDGWKATHEEQEARRAARAPRSYEEMEATLDQWAFRFYNRKRNPRADMIMPRDEEEDYAV